MFFNTYGLLWQNARNLKYIKWFNTPLAKKLADSKLKTKEFLRSKGIPIPETLGILSSHDELTEEFISSLMPPFVVKPNKGFGWKGIIVVDKLNAIGDFVANTWDIFTQENFIYFIIFFYYCLI